MTKRARQYAGLFSAVIVYYLIHEGAHLLYALFKGVFKKINFIGLGMQVDIYAENLSSTELGIFCILGSLASLLSAYILVLSIGKIAKSHSKIFKACAYYVTIALLFLDPLYLSILCDFFGGGDMNGIRLIIPEIAARIIYGVILLINVWIFIKIVLPRYKAAFADKES